MVLFIINEDFVIIQNYFNVTENIMTIENYFSGMRDFIIIHEYLSVSENFRSIENTFIVPPLVVNLQICLWFSFDIHIRVSNRYMFYNNFFLADAHFPWIVA